MMHFKYAPLFVWISLAAQLHAQQPANAVSLDVARLSIIPKREMGTLEFLAKQPEYDGRGVVVAIFDTGVDPGADGLRKTSNGLVKVIDMIDGTGSGDVDCKTVQSAKDGLLMGFADRKLRINPAWINPSGRYHVGWKRGYDFFPEELVTRLKRERRKVFDEQQAKVEADLRRAIANMGEPTAKKIKASELQARLAQLQAASKSYDDPGPVLDCVVFHDGKTWRAAVDTNEDGAFADESVLTNYRAEQQFGTFRDSLLNFAVNVYDNGNTLSIVVDSGPHGTHVAGIVAGSFPDQPERNGIAPGARIVSVKIGDPRLGGMETGQAIVRGLKAVIRNRCDLVNMSFGEPSATPDHGRLTELISQIVDDHGVIFVASAGNEGPALSTVGCPGGTTSAVLGVGAYVSPEMMRVEYSMRNPPPGLPYSWSSRGPTTDGDWGVDIFAPGGAISPIPRWMLAKSIRMNGTSMSSPSACGALAVLLSGLKEQQIRFTPYSVRRAIQNAARPVPAAEPHAQGPGLLHIPAAFEQLVAQKDDAQILVRLSCRTAGGERGIYLREAHQTGRRVNVGLVIRTHFPKDTPPQSKTDFHTSVELESTAEWATCGEFVDVTHLERGNLISVDVDPRSLSPGAHFAEIRGYAAGKRNHGPLFRLPITIIRPSIPGESQSTFVDGRLERQFFPVPAGARWARISLKCLSAPTTQRFLLHAVQLLPGETYEKASVRKFLSLSAGQSHAERIKVTGGRTLEVCTAQYWSSRGTAEAELSVRFGGVSTSADEIRLTPSEPAQRVELTAALRRETLEPKGKLTYFSRHLKPSSSEVSPLNTARDALPDGSTIYRQVLTYEFEQTAPGNVTLRFPWIDDLLYDSAYSYQFAELLDAGKRRIATVDMFPASIRLGKGRYKYVMTLHHGSVASLEKLKHAPLTIDRSLSPSLAVTFAATRVDLLTGKSFPKTALDAKQMTAVWAGLPSSATLPANLQSGDVLWGTATFGTAAAANPSDRPGGYRVSYVVDIAPSEIAAKPASSSRGAKLEDDLLEAKLTRLKSLNAEPTNTEFNKLADALLKEKPKHLPVLVERLKRLDDDKHRKQRLEQVVAAADAVIAQIDAAQLVRHFGQRAVDAKSRGLDGKLKKQRDFLVDSLYRKGRALGYMELPDVIAKKPIKDAKAHAAAFEANFTELSRWVDTTDEKYGLLHIRRDRRLEHYGSALKLLNKYIAGSAPNFWYYKKRRDLYEKLGWSHLHTHEAKWLKLRFQQPDEKAAE